MLIDTYKKDDRKAEIHNINDQFEVKLYHYNILIEIIPLKDKSIYYAESCAENYVERIGTFYQ
jgi:hypothetical protein